MSGDESAPCSAMSGDGRALSRATRVVVTRSGGFAGLVRTAEVDDDAAAQALAAEANAAAERPDPGLRRDGFTYEFRIVAAETRTVTLSETQVDDALAALLRPLF